MWSQLRETFVILEPWHGWMHVVRNSRFCRYLVNSLCSNLLFERHAFCLNSSNCSIMNVMPWAVVQTPRPQWFVNLRFSLYKIYLVQSVLLLWIWDLKWWQLCLFLHFSVKEFKNFCILQRICKYYSTLILLSYCYMTQEQSHFHEDKTF
jgi:hypothetical protein